MSRRVRRNEKGFELSEASNTLVMMAKLRPYYRNMFIPSIPSEWEHTVTNRVVTDDYIVEEAKVRLVHTKQMDWFLPGVPPTNKPIEMELVIVIQFRDGKMAAERIYWDQAAVLRQIGKLGD